MTSLIREFFLHRVMVLISSSRVSMPVFQSGAWMLAVKVWFASEWATLKRMPVCREISKRTSDRGRFSTSILTPVLEEWIPMRFVGDFVGLSVRGSGLSLDEEEYCAEERTGKLTRSNNSDKTNPLMINRFSVRSYVSKK